MTCGPLDLRDDRTACAVLRLQRLAYRVEADLIGRDDLPPLHETLDQLQRCEETFLGMWRQGELAGAVSYRREGPLLDLHRVMVNPAHFRTGVARALITRALDEHPDAVRVIVSTGRDNLPARRLYEHLGFMHAGDREVLPDLFVSAYALQRTRPTGT